MSLTHVVKISERSNFDACTFLNPRLNFLIFLPLLALLRSFSAKILARSSILYILALRARPVISVTGLY